MKRLIYVVKYFFFYFSYVLHYFDINPAPFEFFDESFDVVIPLKKRRKFSYISEVSEYDIVIACHSILQSAINHFKHKWNWSRFYKYLTNADDRIKWYVYYKKLNNKKFFQNVCSVYLNIFLIIYIIAGK